MAIVRRIKDKLKTMAEKKISVRKKESKPAVIKKDSTPLLKKAVIGAQELTIEKAKFSHPETMRTRRYMPQDLPYQYGQEKIVLQVRDPWWLHAYWEIKSATFDRLCSELKELFYRAKKILRVYDVSQIIFNGHNAHRSFDIQLTENANSWYIDTGGPGRSWCVDFGLLLPDGRFIPIVRSNTVQTPLDGPSWITDEEWMIPDEMFARLYGLGFGFGQSSPVGKLWQERMKKALFSGILSSPGLSSGASPVKKLAKERKFWLVVDCELIVYGATEPDAKVTVQGRPINLRQDGTFTLRFALPDGKQTIPVKAVSSDQVEERTITPIVTRETKASVVELKASGL